jgi:hypothetical protein
MKRRFPLALVLLCAGSAFAQDAAIRVAIKDYLAAVTRNNTADKDAAIQELYEEEVRRALSAAVGSSQASLEARAFQRLEFTAEARRFDRQVAGEAGANASTALAALSGVTDFLSTALESGLVNRTTEGSVSTFRVNAGGVAKLFNPQTPCFLRLSDCQPTVEQHLKGLSLALSFDQAQPEATDPMATATVEGTNTMVPAGTKIPGLARVGAFRTFSARWQIARRKSLEDAAQQNRWREAMKGVRSQAEALAKAGNQYIQSLNANEAWKTWRGESTRRLDTIAASSRSETDKLAAMTSAFKEDLAVFVDSADDAVAGSALRVMETLGEFRKVRNELLHDVLYPTAATVEYLYQEPLNQPAYSTVRFIVGKPFGQQPETAGAGANAEAPISQFTANFAASIYHSAPADTGSFRDVQAAIQLDRTLPIRPGSSKVVASIAGYYQYMAQKGILTFNNEEATPLVGIPLPQAAKILLDTKGSIFVTQAKVTFPLGDSGVNFPIAVSWANRSELIKASYTKLQFGFTFDVDKLMEALEAKK